MSKVSIIIPDKEQEILCNISEATVLYVAPEYMILLESSDLEHSTNWNLVFQNKNKYCTGKSLLLLGEPVTVPAGTSKVFIEKIQNVPKATLH